MIALYVSLSLLFSLASTTHPSLHEIPLHSRSPSLNHSILTMHSLLIAQPEQEEHCSYAQCAVHHCFKSFSSFSHPYVTACLSVCPPGAPCLVNLLRSETRSPFLKRTPPCEQEYHTARKRHLPFFGASSCTAAKR